MAGAEPFAHVHESEVGVLLVHGFTGAPAEMRALGAALAAHEIGSEAVLLRGHGTHPDDMLEYGFSEWIEDVERGLGRILGRHKRAVIVGLSMGGTLALNVAARHADDPRVAGLVTICAPLAFDDPRLRFVHVLGRLIKWQAWGNPDIMNRAAWDSHVGYRRFPTGAIRELLALTADTVHRLGAIHQPILIVQANADHVVPPRNADLIHDGVRSRDRRVLMLDDCYHVITIDFAAERLNADVVAFVERLLTPRAPGLIASPGDLV
jgi:carboxylesterase